MRILFMGTPEFAVASLRRLVEDGHTICGVYTQPDKPKNRGHKLAFSPVKEYALTKELPVFQPQSLRSEEAAAQVRELAPELIVVAAYGKLLPEEILETPPKGSINVHSSLLPKYRGAAPINWAILNGETETGVSIMYMAKELDAGDVILQKSTAIGPREDAQALTERLAALGADALSETVRVLESGMAERRPQDHSLHTYAPMLDKKLSPVDWSRSAHEINCQIRGLIPWPCATTDIIDGKPMKLFASEETGETTKILPGVIVAAGKMGIEVACGDGKILRLTEIQANGGKRMAAAAYLLGHPIQG
ncbi:MAG: methionyl-tRNA formyltransferase [Oscillibacter sp.]|jgi:methionyl-tRNA formyltransferase|nr:methionyl-tRNA formyltransferase [Oscillibacter sp.]